jgi:LptD protein
LINSGSKRLIVAFGIFIILAQVQHAYGHDSIKNVSTVDSLKIFHADSAKTDSLHLKKKHKKSEIEDPVKYSSKDSILFDLPNKKVYLFGDAVVTYQNIELKAAYIEFNMSDETVYATGVKDSTGNLTGLPDFKEGSEEFVAHWLRYNFKTKKGFIQFVKTKQEEGTLIGDSTKREPNGNVNLKGGKYSTCDLDHPHFYIGLMKAKSVPGDKIVSGPAYLVVADIPLPLIVPFGFFPNTTGISSGILAPTWGEENNRGFYLADGGYYFAFSDYFDLTLRGSLYSNGSWGTSEYMHYKKRYKYTGSFNFVYDLNVNSEIGLPDYSVVKDYRLTWNHSQDQKASPNNTFSAAVNMSSSTYDKHNSYDPISTLTNTKSSNISYTHLWPNSPFHFSANLNHEQDALTKKVDMTLPDMSLVMNTITPFQSKDATGEPKWYDNIQIGYNAQFKDYVHTNDSDLFTKRTFNNIQNGFQQQVLPSVSFKLNNFINLTPSISYTGVLFQDRVHHKSNKVNDTTYIVSDSVSHKPKYTQAFTPEITLGISPKFYGMYMFKNSKIKALRHVMSPSVTLSFTPDVRKLLENYYDTVRYGPKQEQVRTYSYYENQIFPTPYPPGGKTANISMSLHNSFDLKYLSENDTSSTEKKISILKNLDFSTNYNLLADSFNLSDIRVNAGTDLFDNKLNINSTMTFSPYAVNEKNGYVINHYELREHGRLARLTEASLSMGTSFSSAQGKSTNTENQTATTATGLKQNPATQSGPYNNQEVNFDLPWSVTLSYTFGYTLSFLKAIYNQGVTFNGSLGVTKRWQVTLSSGYDFVAKQVTLTNITINRDLHCWQMSFNWTPFGYYTHYSFTISAKASMLHDLKYTKQSDWRQQF